MIDEQPNGYTVEDLRTMKAAHEKFVFDSLAEEVGNVTFAELEVVTKAMIDGAQIEDEEFTLTPPKKKIRKNGLSSTSASMIRLGMANSRTVEHFITSATTWHSGFGESLKARFIEQYNKLRAEGAAGDDLFEGMRAFASAGSFDFRRQAAGLSVLTYLFEKCEVFEK